jgi:hypothetical protein
MTNQLTEELVHWELAEAPDGPETAEDEEADRIESTAE